MACNTGAAFLHYYLYFGWRLWLLFRGSYGLFYGYELVGSGIYLIVHGLGLIVEALCSYLCILSP